MSLLEQAQELTARLKHAVLARANVEEAHALEQLRLQFFEQSASVDGHKRRIDLLRANGVPVTIPPSVASSLSKVREVGGKFAQSPRSTTLRLGRRWTSFIDILNALSAALGQALTDDWKSYCGSALFGGAPPDQVRTRLAMTPQNQTALTRYSELFRRFSAYRNRIPSTQEEFDDVHLCSAELEKIEFAEDIPESVRAFFAATATAKGAGLELLLPEVWQWLFENNLLETYVVKARFQGAVP